MGKLDEKVCIVTGAAYGIGLAIAQMFAEQGARLVAAAHQDCGARIRDPEHPRQCHLPWCHLDTHGRTIHQQRPGEEEGVRKSGTGAAFRYT